MSRNKSKANWVSLAVAITVLSGCTHQYSRQAEALAPLPQHWQTEAETYSDLTSWRTFIDAPDLEALLNIALRNNIQIELAQKSLAIAEEQLKQSKMTFWPSLSAGLSGTRAGSNVGGFSQINNNFELSVQASFEVNLWGQLSDAKRAVAFGYAAERARYQQLRLKVVGEVATAWLTLVETRQLVVLYQHRLEILQQNLTTIESGYRSGLNTALEVYLTRNDVQTALASYEQQLQANDDAKRNLALLLGDYPHLDFARADRFPATQKVIAPELPTQVLAQRPDLEAAWLDVLAQNAQVGVAYKARFPALTLSARGGHNASDLSDLLDTDPFWSLGSSLLQPLLAQGRLRAAENIERLKLEQLERQYRESVYQAFSQVESALQTQASLDKQFEYVQQAAENARLAEKLSFDQYLKGLVSYTTFLEAQRRAIDADIQLITLSRRKVANRISLHGLLAGDLDFFNPTETDMHSTPKSKRDE